MDCKLNWRLDIALTRNSLSPLDVRDNRVATSAYSSEIVRLRRSGSIDSFETLPVCKSDPPIEEVSIGVDAN